MLLLLVQTKGGEATMSDVLERVEVKGIQKGIQESRDEAIQ